MSALVGIVAWAIVVNLPLGYSVSTAQLLSEGERNKRAGIDETKTMGTCPASSQKITCEGLPGRLTTLTR